MRRFHLILWGEVVNDFLFKCEVDSGLALYIREVREEMLCRPIRGLLVLDIRNPEFTLRATNCFGPYGPQGLECLGCL